jgi:hypothetical protein
MFERGVLRVFCVCLIVVTLAPGKNPSCSYNNNNNNNKSHRHEHLKLTKLVSTMWCNMRAFLTVLQVEII